MSYEKKVEPIYSLKGELIGMSTTELMSKDEVAKRYPHLAIVDLDIEKLWQLKKSGS
jgi:hypothetical protein